MAFRKHKLPPRNADSIHNKGFVSFRTLLNKQAQKGDTIYNRAAIFFDYQKPVITNKAKVVFIKNSDIKRIYKNSFISIYPNPTKGGFHYTSNGAKRLDMYNAMGQIVLEIDLQESGYIELPETIADGVYTLMSEGIHNGHIIVKR